MESWVSGGRYELADIVVSVRMTKSIRLGTAFTPVVPGRPLPSRLSNQTVAK